MGPITNQPNNQYGHRDPDVPLYDFEAKQFVDENPFSTMFQFQGGFPMTVPYNNDDKYYVIDLSSWHDFAAANPGGAINGLAFEFSDTARGDKNSMEHNEDGFDLEAQFFKFKLKLPDGEYYCKLWSTDTIKYGGVYAQPTGPLDATFVNKLVNEQCSTRKAAWDRAQPISKYADADEVPDEWVKLETCEHAYDSLSSRTAAVGVAERASCAAFG